MSRQRAITCSAHSDGLWRSAHAYAGPDHRADSNAYGRANHTAPNSNPAPYANVYGYG